MVPVPANPLVRFSLAALAATLLLSLSACASASSGSLRTARGAETTQNYDVAVAEYAKLLRDNPNDREARLGLERSKLRAAQDHFSRARRDAAAGKLEEAMAEYQLAAELNPGDGDIERELQATRTQLRAKVAVREDGKTRLESLIAQSIDSPLPGAALPDEKLPDSVIFRDASSRDIYSAIGKFTNLSVLFDPTFRDQPVSIDLRGASLEQALNSLSTTTRNFWRSTGPRAIIVIPDTAAKRREYEEEIVRTFYLSNADLKETVDILRIVVDARRIAPMTANNAITIKDTAERITAAGRIITAIDKARPEVIIDVELLEVNRTHLHEYGLQVASPSSAPTGINGQADANKEGLSLRALRTLTQADILLTNLPSLYYRLLKNDSATRILANPQLRTSEGIPAKARFGERVPVPVTTFAPIAAGGVQTQPITSFNYEPIGVNIDITPRMHHDDAVTLSLKIELSSISGTGFGGLPTFGSRSIDTVIRLKDGETNMLAGLIRDEERTSLASIPGLGDIPVIGRLFGYNRKETQETDIILTLTPRIVRVLNLTEEDLQPFRMGRDSGAPLTDVPLLPIPLPTPLPKPPGGDASTDTSQPMFAPGVPTAPGPAAPVRVPPKPPK
jgi:general secretion pathway protein D